MIINKFCSIVLYESPGAYLKQAFLQKSSVYCTLIIAQHFQKKIQKEKKYCAEQRKDEIIDNIKASIREDLNIEFVQRF